MNTIPNNESIKTNRCSFLMASCDAYEDLWMPFFKLMDIYWADCPYPIYLGTDSKKYIPEVPHSFQVNTLNYNGKGHDNYGKRLIKILEQIPTEYVLFTIDDYFFRSKVAGRYIEEILDIMDTDSNIASFQMSGSRFKPHLKEIKEGLDYVPLWPKGWATHFLPTVWRRSVLMKWLRPWESAWGFEGYGSARYRRWHYKEKVFVVRQPEIYDYFVFKDSAAVVHGKWLDIPQLDEFFNKNHIKIEYNKRKKISWEDFQAESMWEHQKQLTIWQLFIKCINYCRSFLP